MKGPSPKSRPPLGEVAIRVVETAVEIASSVAAAGQGVFQAALKLYRLAQEVAAPSGEGESRPGATSRPAPPSGSAPAGTRKASGAIALDSDAIEPRPTASNGAAADPSHAPTVEPARGDRAWPAANSEMPPARASSRLDLPERYDLDRLVAVPRDPDWLFAYWETRDATRRRLEARLAGQGAAPPTKHRLRIAILGVGGAEVETLSWTVELPPGATSWYVEVGRPSARVRVSYGIVAGEAAAFVPLLPPVEVSMPSRELAPESDARWAQLGDHGLATGPAPEQPHERLREISERLIRHVHGANAESSREWPPTHRLVELDFGSHASPRS